MAGTEKEPRRPFRTDPRLQQEGGTIDEHGREPGEPSRVGTGSQAPPADAERVREAEETRERGSGL
ncbi:hypothetical protein ACWDYJ_35100 [Streptomyces sp. NPDC003042]